MDAIKCLVKLKTHTTLIKVDEEGLISCFKYTDRSECDLAQFTNEFDACEWILEPIATSRYYVDIPE
jgi:hypothetical protein